MRALTEPFVRRAAVDARVGRLREHVAAHPDHPDGAVLVGGGVEPDVVGTGGQVVVAADQHPPPRLGVAGVESGRPAAVGGEDHRAHGHPVGPRGQHLLAAVDIAVDHHDRLPVVVGLAFEAAHQDGQPLGATTRRHHDRDGGDSLPGSRPSSAASQQGGLLAGGAQRRNVAAGDASAGVPGQVGHRRRAQGGLESATPAPLVGVRQTRLHEPLATARGLARPASGVDRGRRARGPPTAAPRSRSRRWRSTSSEFMKKRSSKPPTARNSAIGTRSAAPTTQSTTASVLARVDIVADRAVQDVCLAPAGQRDQPLRDLVPDPGEVSPGRQLGAVRPDDPRADHGRLPRTRACEEVGHERGADLEVAVEDQEQVGVGHLGAGVDRGAESAVQLSAYDVHAGVTGERHGRGVVDERRPGGSGQPCCARRASSRVTGWSGSPKWGTTTVTGGVSTVRPPSTVTGNPAASVFHRATALRGGFREGGRHPRPTSLS